MSVLDRPPAFQFYPADWQNNIKLQVCSMAAQGLLINLMCLMHQSEKYGYLLINGVIKPAKTVSKLLRLSPRTFGFLLNELLSNGVLHRDENGCIFCKRMVKDQALRDIRREAGARGGNPNLVNPIVNQTANQTANQKTPPSSSSSSSSTSITYCSEPVPDSRQPEAVLQIPLSSKKTDPKFFKVTQGDIDNWQDIFQGIDVLYELKKCRQWNIDNPTRRKTEAGIRKHITGWIAKAQDRYKGPGGYRSEPRSTLQELKGDF